ncbi:MAG: T9SS type A sorting domain-containing protein [Bacteroidetes bacterium]|jgi:hypothetical protein|nr:T9SS type A sorting domain-containing protein [Bacteroidota bacterium]
MNIQYTISSLMLLFFLFSSDALAQQEITLNSIPSSYKQVTAQTVTGHAQERIYYQLNSTPLQQGELQVGDQINLQLSRTDEVSLFVRRIEQYTERTISVFAHETGKPDQSFTFTYSDGILTGIFNRTHDTVYHFEFDPDAERNYIAKESAFHDDAQYCSVDALLPADGRPFNEISHAGKGVQNAISAHVPHLSAMASSLEDEITIDILIPYTENARLWADESSFGSIEQVIASAMALSQTALDNSEVFIELRLVHMYEVFYTGDSLEQIDEGDFGFVDAIDHLRRLTRNPDNRFDLCGSSADCTETDFDGFMEDVHQKRDEFGADLVAAVMSEPNTGGIAWLNNSTAGNSPRGFSVNRVQQIGNNTTLIHEVGHNMGSAHARNQPTAAANDLGGLFVYSTGNRFSNPTNDYATVMAYTTGGFQGIQYFSNPDVRFNSLRTGNTITSTNEAGPANSARSFREIKRVIASYRPTVTDAPVAGVDETSISAVLNQDNSTATVPVTIRNDGQSDLMWDFDFDISSGTVARQKLKQPVATVKVAPGFKTFSGNNVFEQAEEDGTILSTGFEGRDGFSPGDQTAIAGWRAFSEEAQFQLSDENPSSGFRHLRLPHRSETDNSVFVRSPFFGPQPMGEFTVSFKIAALDGSVQGESETFDVYIFDGSTATISSGIIVSGGTIFARTIDENGDGAFGSTQTPLPLEGTYQQMEIRYNPNNRTIDYVLNGTQIASNPYPLGRKPDYIYFGHRNGVAGTQMDIDELEVVRNHTPFNWLIAEETAGVVPPASTQTVNLTLNAVGVETGTYQTVVRVRSNDPENPVIEVPVSADIELATSNETGTEVPDQVSLKQNFPNPFNPSTRIQFTLDRSTDVTLEVFNIAGQRVARLVQGTLNAGQHERTFNAGGLSSGVYIYRLQTQTESITRQMVLIK